MCIWVSGLREGGQMGEGGLCLVNHHGPVSPNIKWGVRFVGVTNCTGSKQNNKSDGLGCLDFMCYA